jgi:hypothetical protein
MTLDELVKEGKTLSYDDLNLVVCALQKEMNDRRDAEQMELWNKVCDALDLYVRTYGYFTFINGDEEFTLYRGDYAFGEVGEIAIND